MKPGKSVYIFIGPPGSGKGTLSQLCAKTLNWVQLSTGNLCRKHVAEQTEIGKQIDFALKSGKLVSDSLVNTMVQEWFEKTIQQSDNIILDGYPRTVAQAESLYDFLQKYKHVSVWVIRFFIDDQSVINRISGRLVCKNKNCQEVYSLNPDARIPTQEMQCDVCCAALGRRNDDADIAIKDRLQTYHKHEQDLLNFYRQTSFTTKELAVEKQLDQVFEDFKKLVEISENDYH